ncbi:hypothetical protein [Mesorhizobium escarrei]|uniref:Nuclear transport factor 2 family protein n=1 Tax=Mesorhizobium escarrei TaxID=666018 RepID=A0ABM9EIG4_9HYPH|nr:hypothetical protein [Mesorhizobium escarrei]CAH2409168.1 hypothetical protein MES5069_770012 [Mesorhizobium escarrei]
MHATVLYLRAQSGVQLALFHADGNSIRGVNLMRVADGLIVEAMGYVKG